MAWGATLQEWEAFESLILPDLLPTVCDPTIRRHPTSNEGEGLDKVPSVVQLDGFGRRMKGWPSHVTTSTHDWKIDDRLGICIVARTLFAIDIDIRDIEAAQSCEGLIRDYLGIDGMRLPLRMRTGTGKRLMMFRVYDGPERLKKQVVHTPSGNIEFLFHGQQFRVAGTHADGNRLLWPDGIPTSLDQVPAIGIQELIGLIRELNMAYRGRDEEILLDSSGTFFAKTRRASQVDEDDPMVAYLHEQDWVKGTRHDGALDIYCPWAGDHKNPTPDNMTEATFFPMGLGGNLLHPGFKCMHATCSGRTHMSFLNKIGYETDDFQIVPVSPTAPALTRPSFVLTGKGKIVANIENIVAMFGWETGFGWSVRYDRFCDQIFYKTAVSDEWKPITDQMYTRFRMRMARIGMEKDAPKDVARDATEIAAHDCMIDSAQDWLTQLSWDGVPRVSDFHLNVLKVSDTPYHRAVVEYMWTALAGRVLAPGCKADMMPIFIGPQGIRKSTMVENIAPSPTQFTAVSLGTRDPDLARQLRGKVVAEWDEMRGLNTRDAEGIKGWLSHRYDEWIPKFKELAVNMPRRFVVIGTANDRQVLNDPTGARRFLPLRVEQVIDAEYVAANREQLWAEARTMFLQNGVLWKQAEALAPQMHQASTMRDIWEDNVTEWLARQGGRDGWNSMQIIRGACDMHTSVATPLAYHRLRRIMSKIGWTENDNGKWYCNLV